MLNIAFLILFGCFNVVSLFDFFASATTFFVACEHVGTVVIEQLVEVAKTRNALVVQRRRKPRLMHEGQDAVGLGRSQSVGQPLILQRVWPASANPVAVGVESENQPASRLERQPSFVGGSGSITQTVKERIGGAGVVVVVAWHCV